MNDLIDRQAAIDVIFDEPLYESGMIKRDADEVVPAIYEKIKSSPPAQPEQRWIPCRERLPDLWDERYLVSLAWGGVGVMEYKSTGFHNYGSFSPVPIETVTAWMPLPEPYKEDEHEAD